MSDPCSSSNSNFAIFEWDAGTEMWNAVCNNCHDGHNPPPLTSLPPGSFNGEQVAKLCIRMVVDPPPGDK